MCAEEVILENWGMILVRGSVRIKEKYCYHFIFTLKLLFNLHYLWNDDFLLWEQCSIETDQRNQFILGTRINLEKIVFYNCRPGPQWFPKQMHNDVKTKIRGRNETIGLVGPLQCRSYSFALTPSLFIPFIADAFLINIIIINYPQIALIKPLSPLPCIFLIWWKECPQNRPFS